MDPTRFDALARTLATPQTRRGLLAGLAAVVVGARAASAQACPPGQAANRKGDCACPPGTDPCPTGCVNTKTDLKSCGACGRTCTGGTCAKGECRCPAGSVLCGGVCRTQASFAADLGNCGACGVSCEDNNACTADACSDGVCRHTPVTCPNSEACTQVTCDPASGCVYDIVARNGFACASLQVTSGGTCSGGVCVAPTTTTTTTTPRPGCTTSADCELGLVCNPASGACNNCDGDIQCADALTNYGIGCTDTGDGSGRRLCLDYYSCVCPGTCADCPPGTACFRTGSNSCEGKNLCCSVARGA